jgi:hypothetical protein
MTLQLSVAARNARLDAIEVTAGTGALLKIYSGAQPANCAAAAAGTMLTSLTLPTDWMSAAAAGVKSALGTWQQLSATAAGTAGHWRLYDSTGTTCHAQGSCTATGGGGDMTIDNPVLAVAQQFNVTSFAITDANA